jgi:methionine-rich copper-binding protein CopC
MSFSRRILLSRLKGLITGNIPTIWTRLVYLFVLFIIVLSSFHYLVKSRAAAGNLAISGAFSVTTATALPQDTTPPTVTSTDPAAGATNVDANAWVTASFSENMNAATVNGSTVELLGPSNTLVSATVSFSKRTAILIPTTALAAGTTYTARVRGGSTDPRVKDLAGNALAADLTWTFTTALTDTTPPYVISHSPLGWETNVHPDANVTVTFNEAMNPTTVNGSTVELLDPSNALVSATVSYDAASRTAILDPAASLAVGTTYTARVRGGSADPRVKDLAGNAFAGDVPLSFIFTTRTDITPPTVTSFTPVSGATNVNVNATVTVTFSETMIAATVGSSTIELRDPSNALVSATVYYNEDVRIATLVPTAPLTIGTTYTARVRGGSADPRVKDVAGNALAADVTWSFTTADTTPPTVTSVSPTSGATNVAINANVTVTFSEAMNASTVGTSTIELRNSSNVLVAATVSYNPATFTATLDPNASLEAGMTYTARVRGGGTDPRVKDVAGNALAADVTWSFTTLANLNMALIDPINRIGLPGEDLLSRNYNWSLPLLSLPGRAGLDLGLVLSLNSLIYTRAESVIHFDPNQGYPAPGFSLGFPEIRNAFINTDANTPSYLLTMPSGRRVEFRQTNINVYDAMDSSYMHLIYNPINSVFVLYTTDGTQCRFVDVTGSGDYKCVQIKDRNGNYITISYGNLAEIRTITDTLDRVINFNYGSVNDLLSITQNWGGQTHTWATFAYGTQTIQTNFQGLTLNGTANGTPESVLTSVSLADGSVYSFEYNTYAQVKTIRKYAPSNSNPAYFPGDYLELASTTYGLPDNATNPQTDCPRITSRTDWAYDWNNFNAVTSTYAADASYAWGQVTSPDGTTYKEFFATTGWQRGLTTQTETWSGGVRKKWTTLQWTQDNTSVVYKLNPRVTETNIYDEAGNRRRTTVSYTIFGLPSDVYEYDADATTVLRHTQTDYNLSAVYTDRRIIGLPSAQYLKDGNNALFSKVTYEYDQNDQNPNPYLQHQGPPIHHDTANYGPGFVQGRGNLNIRRRWDVNDPNNSSEYETGYNTSGSVIFTRDPLNHPTNIIYDDSFSDLQNRNTYAYPTTMTDPDGFPSTVKYNYDFGAVTRTEDPKHAVVARTYDAAGRLDRVTNEVNGAYSQYHYGTDQRYVMWMTTVNDLSSELYQYKAFDGHGRLHVEATEHPGSIGGFKAVIYDHDNMGRMMRQSNPTEIAPNWVPAGDDAAGWVWSYQSYDWKGRPTVSTNQDETTTEFLYGGCGCAGGQVVVARDEVGRKQETIHDVFGRPVKKKLFEWDGITVYSTTMTTYNVRDQITRVRVYQGDEANGANCPTASCQETTRSYDGHGRVSLSKTPIELVVGTSYEYFKDDTLKKVIDARGASREYTYYNRALVNTITYAWGGGTVPSQVSFTYDELGNRTTMTDGLGSQTYNYDTLGRMLSETRHFNGVGSFTLNYQYTIGGQLKKITDPYNDSIEYSYDKAGQMISVTGSPFGSPAVTQYINGIQYRAWGGVKGVAYGNGLNLSNSYNARQQLELFELRGPQVYVGDGPPFGLSPELKAKTQYQYYADGHLRFADNFPDTFARSDDRFDRAFSYDQVGRLNEAFSGSEARDFINQTVTSPTSAPYRHTYQHNVWGNLTTANERYWSHSNNINSTYQNNRKDGWQYDNAGNIVNDGSSVYTYDAIGRNETVTIIGESTQTTQGFDGDGQVIKRTASPRGFPVTTWYLRSSVLGKMVNVINGEGGFFPSGTKYEGHVYAGESLIAKQSHNTSDSVGWVHENPLTGGSGWSYYHGGYSPEVEPDPMGVPLGWNDSFIQNPDPLPNDSGKEYFKGEIGGGLDQYEMCEYDGIDFPCNDLASKMASGAATIAPTERVTSIYNPISRKYELTVWTSYADGFSGYMPLSAKYNNDGTWNWKVPSGWRPLPGEGRHIAGGYGPDGEADGELGRSSYLGIGGSGGGGNLFPLTPVQTPLANNPCQHMSPAVLDYSVKRWYGVGHNAVEETAEQHIIRRHGSGPQLLGNFPPGTLSSVSFYISDPPTSGQKMFDDYIKYLNNATFNRPTTVFQLSNGDYQFVKDFPPIKVLPFAPGSPRYIGWDRTSRSNTSRNNLIIKSDCKTVQTSYPGV